MAKPGGDGGEASGNPEEALDLFSPSSRSDSDDDEEEAGGEDGGEAVSGNAGAGAGGIPDQLAASFTDNDDLAAPTHTERERAAENEVAETAMEMESREDEQGAEEAKLAASETTEDDDGAGNGGSAAGGGQGGGGQPPEADGKEFLGVLSEAGIGGGEGALEGLEERSEDEEEGGEGAGEGGLEDTGSGGGAQAAIGGEGEYDTQDVVTAVEEREEEEGGVAGSRASVSSSTAGTDAGADVKEEKRRAARRQRRRRRLASGAGAGGAGASIAAGGEGAEGRSGAGAGASRALVAGGQAQDEFAPATPDRVSLLWMGPQATDGSWREPEEDSLWAEAFVRLRLTRWKPQQVTASCRIPCGHWDAHR